MFEAAFAEAGIDAVMIPIGVPPESFAQVVAALRAMRCWRQRTLPHKLAARRRATSCRTRRARRGQLLARRGQPPGRHNTTATATPMH